MIQVHIPPLPTWETWIELLALTWPSLDKCKIRGVNQQTENLYVSLPISLSNKIKIFKKKADQLGTLY